MLSFTNVLVLTAITENILKTDDLSHFDHWANSVFSEAVVSIIHMEFQRPVEDLSVAL